MALPYFISCASSTNTLQNFAGNIGSKENALKLFMGAVAERNGLFHINSGQQSSAEFLCFILQLLRLETLLIASLSMFTQRQLSTMCLDTIKNEFRTILDKISKTDDKLNNPIDDFFYSKLEYSHKCNTCGNSHLKRQSSCFSFESSHRYFTKKDKRSQVTTENLLNLFFRGDDTNMMGIEESNDICHHCNCQKGTEELKVLELAKEIIIIYDRIDSAESTDNLSILSPTEITSLGRKSQCHWKIDEKINFYHVLSNNDSTATRWFKSGIYHSGSTFSFGHYVNISVKNAPSSPELVLIDDSIVHDNKPLYSLLCDENSSLITHYGNAVITLYSSELIRLRLAQHEIRMNNQRRKD